MKRHTPWLFAIARARRVVRSNRTHVEQRQTFFAPSICFARPFSLTNALSEFATMRTFSTSPRLSRAGPPRFGSVSKILKTHHKIIKCQTRRMVTEFELGRALLRRWRRPQNQVEIFKNPWQKSVSFSVPKSATLFWLVHGNNMESLHKTKKYTKKAW